MRRGLATGVVMVGVVVFAIGFSAAFGNLLVSQAVTLIQAIPDALASVTAWLNSTFGTSFDPTKLLEELHITPQTLASVGVDVAGGVLGVVVAILGGVFSLFTLGLFIFYFSADAPRLKRWVARLLPPGRQEVFSSSGGWRSRRPGTSPPAWSSPPSAAGSPPIFLLLIGCPTGSPWGSGPGSCRSSCRRSAPTSPSRCRWSSA